MTTNTTDKTLLTYARIAGLLYLVIIVTGIFSEVFVRSSLIVTDDAAATAGNILAYPGWFRTGFAADVVMLLSDVAIAVLFYVLLKPVSKTLALLAAAFRLTQAAILGFNLLNYYAAMLLMSGAEFLSIFKEDQVYAMVMLFLDLHSHGYDLGLIFFALSSFVLGYLLIKANYFPSILGYGLIAAAVVYLLGSFTRFLLPDYVSMIEPLYIVPFVAEVAFCLWLLIKGVQLPAGEHTRSAQ